MPARAALDGLRATERAQRAQRRRARDYQVLHGQGQLGAQGGAQGPEPRRPGCGCSDHHHRRRGVRGVRALVLVLVALKRARAIRILRRRRRHERALRVLVLRVGPRVGQTAFDMPHPSKAGCKAHALSGKTVVLTGTFPEVGGGAGLSLGKERVARMVESFGGRVTTAISGKTDCLLVGKEPGFAKVSQAQGMGCALLSLADVADQVCRGKLSFERVAQVRARTPMQIDNFSAGYRGSGYGARIGHGGGGGGGGRDDGTAVMRAGYAKAVAAFQEKQRAKQLEKAQQQRQQQQQQQRAAAALARWRSCRTSVKRPTDGGAASAAAAEKPRDRGTVAGRTRTRTRTRRLSTRPRRLDDRSLRPQPPPLPAAAGRAAVPRRRRPHQPACCATRRRRWPPARSPPPPADVVAKLHKWLKHAEAAVASPRPPRVDARRRRWPGRARRRGAGRGHRAADSDDEAGDEAAAASDASEDSEPADDEEAGAAEERHGGGASPAAKRQRIEPEQGAGILV